VLQGVAANGHERAFDRAHLIRKTSEPKRAGHRDVYYQEESNRENRTPGFMASDGTREIHLDAAAAVSSEHELLPFSQSNSQL
jgi:hypothetical protein